MIFFSNIDREKRFSSYNLINTYNTIFDFLIVLLRSRTMIVVVIAWVHRIDLIGTGLHAINWIIYQNRRNFNKNKKDGKKNPKIIRLSFQVISKILRFLSPPAGQRRHRYDARIFTYILFFYFLPKCAGNVYTTLV